ncbi:hypothetical protein ACH3Y9_41985 [Streptomyces sp. WSLK1-5]|uniref:hypothetical protein n=1 Tax=unclassified Streptomyces TaxID=2593676 RepID=UPI0037A99BB9
MMHAFRDQAREVVDASLPEADAVGIGEDPPGQAALGTRPRHRQTGRPRDRWHTGFTDALGAGGLLGQVEDRSVADVPAWLATTR